MGHVERVTEFVGALLGAGTHSGEFCTGQELQVLGDEVGDVASAENAPASGHTFRETVERFEVEGLNEEGSNDQRITPKTSVRRTAAGVPEERGIPKRSDVSLQSENLFH